jgi:hypothetical protein
MTRNKGSRHESSCTAGRCPNKEHDLKINSVHDHLSHAIDSSASGDLLVISTNTIEGKLLRYRFTWKQLPKEGPFLPIATLNQSVVTGN